jgi:translation initiation factor 2 beta subunit (eIF-2beta)/eIF-5
MQQSKNEFKIDFCYYGMRETLVTHIRNLQEVANHLGCRPEVIKNYLAEKLKREANIEGKTLKIKGLVLKPSVEKLISEFRE